MKRQLPAGRRRLKGDVPLAGQDECAGNARGEEQGEIGRSVGRVPVQPGMEAENHKDGEHRGGESVTCKAGDIPEERSEFGDIGHDVGLSLVVTVVLAVPLAVCALGAGTAGWKHIAVAGGYWCALFGISFWVVRRKGAGNAVHARAAFVECRLAIALIGFAAVTFRSPVLLEIVPDILAVAIAAAGCMDGIAVGSSRRLSRAARCRLAERAPVEGRQ